MPEGIFDDPAPPGGPEAAPEAADANPQPDQAAGPDAVQGQAAQAGQPGTEASQQAPQLIAGRFKSVDDLVKSYQEMERERGRLGNELGQLRQAAQQYQQAAAYYYNLAQQLQAQAAAAAQPQPQPSAPAGGQSPLQGPAEEDLPEDKWLEQFYERPYEAGQKLVMRVIRKELPTIQKALEDSLRELLLPIAEVATAAAQPALRLAQQEQFRETLTQKLASEEQQLRQELAAQGVNLDEYGDDIEALFREMPTLAMYPNAFRLAFEVVRSRKAQPPPAPATEAQKKAARIAASVGSRPTTGPMTPEDKIRAEVFGPAARSTGVFD